jgi:hypothetical protein
LGIAVPSSETVNALTIATTPPTTNDPTTTGPAAWAATPGNTKIPAPIIVPIPMVSADSSPRSFASSSSPSLID